MAGRLEATGRFASRVSVGFVAWEWCLDWWGASLSETDPVGAASGPGRFTRGGGWWDGDTGIEASSFRKNGGSPSYTDNDLGIRLFLTLERSAPTPDVPTVVGDPDASVTGDAEKGFVVRPSAKNENVVVEIPDGVDAAKVTVVVAPDVKTVTPNGAVVRIMRDTADITSFLDIPAAVGGEIDLSAATVKPEIEREALDPTQGAQIELSALNPQLTTAPTKKGLVYRLKEGATLEAMEANTTGEMIIGNGQPWTPTIKVKGGASGFYTIRVSK